MQNFQIIEGQKYELINKLGNGAQGQVFKGRNIETNQYVAIKQQPDISENEFKVIQSIKQYKKKYLIEIYGFQQNQNGIQIAMELAKEDFYQYMQTQEFKFLANEQKNQFFIQMLYAVKEFHELGFIHRDLKPENFILFDNKQVKLIDFGVSKQKPQLMVNQTQKIGTSYYMAPEVIQSSHYNESVDIWGLGCIWFEILTGQTFFNGSCGNDIQNQIVLITQNEISAKINNDRILGSKEKQILLRVLQKQANFRLKITEFIKCVEDLKNIQPMQVAFFPQQLNQNSNQIPQNFMPIIQNVQNPQKQFQLVFSASKNFQQIQLPYSPQKLAFQRFQQIGQAQAIDEKFNQQNFFQGQNNQQNILQNKNQAQISEQHSVKEEDLSLSNEGLEIVNDGKDIQIHNQQKEEEEQQKMEKELQQAKVQQEEKFNMMLTEEKEKLKQEFDKQFLKQKEEIELKQQQLIFKGNQERIDEYLKIFKNSFNKIFCEIKCIENSQQDFQICPLNQNSFQNSIKILSQFIQTLQTKINEIEILSNGIDDCKQNQTLLDFQNNLIQIQIEVQEKLAHELQQQNQVFKKIFDDEKSQNDSKNLQIQFILKEDQLKLTKKTCEITSLWKSLSQQLLRQEQEFQEQPNLADQINDAKNLISQNQDNPLERLQQNSSQNKEINEQIQDTLSYHQNNSNALFLIRQIENKIYHTCSEGQFLVLSQHFKTLYQLSQQDFQKLQNKLASSQLNQNEVEIQSNLEKIQNIFQKYTHQLQNAYSINCLKQTFELQIEIQKNLQYCWEQVEILGNEQKFILQEKDCQGLIKKKKQKFQEKLGKKIQYLENQLQNIFVIGLKKQIEEQISNEKDFQNKLNAFDLKDNQNQDQLQKISSLKAIYQEKNQTIKLELQQNYTFQKLQEIYLEKIQYISTLLSKYKFYGTFEIQKKMINNINMMEKKFQCYLSFLLVIKKKNEALLINCTENVSNPEFQHQKFYVDLLAQSSYLKFKIDKQNVEINQNMILLKEIFQNSNSNSIYSISNVNKMLESWQQFSIISTEIQKFEESRLTFKNGYQQIQERLNQLEQYQQYIEKIDQESIIIFNQILNKNQKYYLQLLRLEQNVLLFILAQFQKKQYSIEILNTQDMENQQQQSQQISTLTDDEIQIHSFQQFIKNAIAEIKSSTQESYLNKWKILEKQFVKLEDIEGHLNKSFEGILKQNLLQLIE